MAEPTLREWKIAYFTAEVRRYEADKALFADDDERLPAIRQCHEYALAALHYYQNLSEEHNHVPTVSLPE